MSKQSTMKIIKKSKVKKAGGGGGVVVVADKLLSAIILLPEDMEKLIYSYLPTPERWGKEIILNRYNLPTFVRLLDPAFDFNTMRCFVTVEYEKITKGLNWLKQDSCGNYKMPTESRKKNPFLQWMFPVFNEVQLLHLADANADYNMLRDTVLICKYYLECKKRNDVYRKKYRAEYDGIRCDEDGLLTKKFDIRQGKWKGKEMATWKSNIMPITKWVNRELKRDSMFANNQCYECARKGGGGRWYIKTEEECQEEWKIWNDEPYEPKSVEERSVIEYTGRYSDPYTRQEIKGESLPPFIIKSATSDCSIKVVPDCRQCKRCQQEEINCRIVITSQSF